MGKKAQVKMPSKKIDRFIARHDLDLTNEQYDELLHMVHSLLRNRDNVIKHFHKQLKKFGNFDDYKPNKELHQAIVAGLKCAIRDHGPIQKDLVESATKRIKGNILA